MLVKKIYKLYRFYNLYVAAHLVAVASPSLTCGGQHGAGKKQRRCEVPVPVSRGVIEDGNPIIAGLQGFL